MTVKRKKMVLKSRGGDRPKRCQIGEDTLSLLV